MYKNRSKGFTLIELLVVIAIIGILSAVVLASLNTARTKGNDASIQSNLSTIQTQAEIYYGDNTNSYGTASTACNAGIFADPTISKAIAAFEVANGASTGVCFSSATGYTISSPLSTDSAKHWCVDNKGGVGVRNSAATASTGCPAS